MSNLVPCHLCLLFCIFSSLVLSFCNFCHLSCCLLLFCHFVVCCVVVCYFAICCFVFCLVLSCNLFLVDMIIFAIFCVWYPAIVVILFPIILISILYLTNAWTFSAEHLSLHWIQHWMSTKLEKYLHLSKSLPFPYALFFGKLSLKKSLKMKITDYWIWSSSPVRRALNPFALTFPFETNLMVMYFFLDL